MKTNWNKHLYIQAAEYCTWIRFVRHCKPCPLNEIEWKTITFCAYCPQYCKLLPNPSQSPPTRLRTRIKSFLMQRKMRLQTVDARLWKTLLSLNELNRTFHIRDKLFFLAINYNVRWEIIICPSPPGGRTKQCSATCRNRPLETTCSRRAKAAALHA